MLATKSLAATSGSGGPAWDVSNAEFLGTPVNSFYLGSTGNALSFKTDGTKMYRCNASNQSVDEYDLSTAWDVSTAVFVRQKLSVGSQPFGISFKTDGTKMYIAESLGSDIREFNLSTAWNVSTASFLQQIDVTTNASNPFGISFKTDGTKMYVVRNAASVVEYDLSTAWDVTTAVFLQSLSVSAQQSSVQGLFLSNDGVKLYVNGWGGGNVSEYTLSTAWNISTSSFIRSFSVTALTGNFPGAAFFKSDGTVMYVCQVGTQSRIFQYQLSTAWNISTASYSYPSTKYFSLNPPEASPKDLFFRADGLKMYTVGDTGDSVREYDLATAWAVSSATLLQSFSLSTQDTAPNDIFFKPDGTKMYMCGASNSAIFEYNLSTAWNISSLVFLQSYSVSSNASTPLSLYFKFDGLSMFVLSDSANAVVQYDLSTAWDSSSAAFVRSFSVGSQETTPSGLFFKTDGTKMYVCGANDDDVNEYSLSTPWNISTASFTRLFSVIKQTSDPTGIFFRDNGLQMFITSDSSDAVWAYDLT
jgi:DNA-binding beta-propeller fold protein YncE